MPFRPDEQLSNYPEAHRTPHLHYKLWEPFKERTGLVESMWIAVMQYSSLWAFGVATALGVLRR
jgi:hypothetical protein